jgi:ABC-type multidrug transport system ATPase subunit
MRKRLGIAQAFIGTPKFVILDEPTEGLDPVAAREVRQVVRAIAGDRTLLVSSHNLREIEDLCSEVAILNQGRVVRQDKVENLVGEADEIAFHLPGPPPAELMNSFGAPGFVTGATWDQTGSRLLIRFDRTRSASDDAAQALVAHLVSRGVKFSQMHVGKRLEDRFIEETRSS